MLKNKKNIENTNDLSQAINRLWQLMTERLWCPGADICGGSLQHTSDKSSPQQNK